MINIHTKKYFGLVILLLEIVRAMGLMDSMFNLKHQTQLVFTRKHPKQSFMRPEQVEQRLQDLKYKGEIVTEPENMNKTVDKSEFNETLLWILERQSNNKHSTLDLVTISIPFCCLSLVFAIFCLLSRTSQNISPRVGFSLGYTKQRNGSRPDINIIEPTKSVTRADSLNEKDWIVLK